MNFIERIFATLEESPERVVLQESGRGTETCARELLAQAGIARGFLRRSGLEPGDRCVVIANNSTSWVAIDLALLAEGIVRVPVYTRTPASDVAKVVRDSGAALVLCGDETLRAAVAPGAAPPVRLLAAAVAGAPGVPAAESAVSEPPRPRRDADPLALLYTSGTSGEPKGVVLSVGNLNHILPCTMQRLDELMEGARGPERVFHYLPFCFAGSWILLLTSLLRGCRLVMATDLERLAAHLQAAAPHYLQNVPLVLERVRSGIETKIGAAPPPVPALFRRARTAWERRQEGRGGPADAFWLGVARRTLFRRVRRGISPNLRALICGSAPLAPTTQGFFEMLGIPVLQVYGLTETTAICTMDRPRGPRQLGRVGAAIPGIEMQLDASGEIVVRGPHLFSGYWRRPEATAAVLRDGWLMTGDRGDVDASGNWRILGRVRNVLVLASGHNVAPDPLEERLRAAVPGAEHVLVVGHERAHLVAFFTGDVDAARIEAALERINPGLPHYERVRAFHIHPERFTLENGCLTANGKLKRDVVVARLGAEIEALYGGAAAAAGSARP